MFDAYDNNGVKVARGNNSLVTFTAKIGEDFRFIKVIESIDLIADDIATTFATDYVGKVINNYQNKCLFISAIMVYLNGLKGNILDNSDTAENYVEIDTDAHSDYAKVKGIDISDVMAKGDKPKGSTWYVRTTAKSDPYDPGIVR